jgi:hypothetical protein
VRETWSIEARAFLFGPFPLAHHFWALIDPAGHIADQLHGLATDPKTGVTKAVGHSGHLLLAHSGVPFPWSQQPDQPRHVCLEDDFAAVCACWQKALNVIPDINALQIPYPNLWQHFHRPNSNSIFALFAAVMAFDVPERLPPANALAIGLHTPVSPDILDRYGKR